MDWHKREERHPLVSMAPVSQFYLYVVLHPLTQSWKSAVNQNGRGGRSQNANKNMEAYSFPPTKMEWASKQ